MSKSDLDIRKQMCKWVLNTREQCTSQIEAIRSIDTYLLHVVSYASFSIALEILSPGQIRECQFFHLQYGFNEVVIATIAVQPFCCLKK